MRDAYKCGKIKDEQSGIKDYQEVGGQVEGCVGQEQGWLCPVRGDGITSYLMDHNVMRILGWEGQD